VSTLEAAMARTPMLASAEPKVVGRLASLGSTRHYRRGTYLFHQDDPATEVFFLVSGRVEVSSLSASGRRQLHATIDQPLFFGELGVLGEMARTAAALALEEASVWAVAGDPFLEFLLDHPSAARALLRALARQVRSSEAFVDDLLYLDLKGRVAKRLLELVTPSLEDLPEDGALVPSIVTHADLASLCGGTRENVTRILSDFQKRGVIERDGRRYVLCNVAGLAKLAGL
jgi:CRP/FNR family transcriptional regulator/CRP/FNR family cyclic AMP-dependent transcriptional regulator